MKEQKDTNNNVEEMQKQIEQLNEKLAEMENNWKRALADYKNFEKRMIEEKAHVIARANEGFALRMLMVLDNLEMLEKHSEDVGLKLTIKEFKQVLKDFGIEELNCQEKEFDSSKMDAIEMVEGEKNMVIEVTRKGYTMNNNLLRPSQVKVGKGN
jgi:molecular chaperone GrpE